MKQKLLEMVQVYVLFFFMKSEKLSSYGPKTLILTDFSNNVKKCMFLALPSSFFRLHQNKLNLEQ